MFSPIGLFHQVLLGEMCLSRDLHSLFDLVKVHIVLHVSRRLISFKITVAAETICDDKADAHKFCLLAASGPPTFPMHQLSRRSL